MGESDQRERVGRLDPAAELGLSGPLALGLDPGGLGLGGGRGWADPGLGEPQDEVAQLVEPGHVRADPAMEAGLDRLDVGQGGFGQERRPARRQLTGVEHPVEDEPGAADQVTQPVELVEAAPVGTCHHHPIVTRRIRERGSGSAGPAEPGAGRALAHLDASTSGTTTAPRARSGSGSCATLRPMDQPPAGSTRRRLVSAEILSIGTELTSGETRDTNAGELARSLTGHGVDVIGLSAIPDRRDSVEATLRAALARVDLVVSTGGLGPTPDDLTRESIAAVWGETPTIDPSLEAWLRQLWERRGLPFPEMNLKQAWLIPSARALANPNGTAPGWWVDRPDGRVAIALPGPPREMRPIWRDTALPLLRERGLGADRAVRTLRLTGIGESLVADRLGEALLRQANPSVATYARADAVDIRLSASAPPAAGGRPGRSAEDLLDAIEPAVLAAVGDHVWARGQTTWGEAVGAELDRLGWSLAARELGLGGALVALLGADPRLTRGEVLPAPRRGAGSTDPVGQAGEVRRAAGSDVGLAVAARSRGADTAVSVAVVTPSRTVRRRSMAFLGGELGRSRAAIVGLAALLEVLRSESRPAVDG